VSALLPTVSVLIGARDAPRTVAACLAEAVAQANALGGEVIAAVAGEDGPEADAARRAGVTCVVRATDALVPELWGAALEKGAAPVVVFTTATCVPGPRWLQSLLAALDANPQAGGAGGPIDGPEGGAPSDWAAYFVRYSAYIPPMQPGEVIEIPGDNAAYRRADLARCASASTPASGKTRTARAFWETLVHAELRAIGRRLVVAPQAVVRFNAGTNAAAFLRARFRHGRHFGSTREGLGAVGRIARAAAGPALVPVLLARIFRRVAASQPRWRRHVLSSLPWLLAFLAAWSAGESLGYLRPGRTTP
jgi:hypothetical protein